MRASKNPWPPALGLADQLLIPTYSPPSRTAALRRRLAFRRSKAKTPSPRANSKGKAPRPLSVLDTSFFEDYASQPTYAQDWATPKPSFRESYFGESDPTSPITDALLTKQEAELELARFFEKGINEYKKLEQHLIPYIFESHIRNEWHDVESSNRDEFPHNPKEKTHNIGKFLKEKFSVASLSVLFKSRKGENSKSSTVEEHVPYTKSKSRRYANDIYADRKSPILKELESEYIEAMKKKEVLLAAARNGRKRPSDSLHPAYRPVEESPRSRRDTIMLPESSLPTLVQPRMQRPHQRDATRRSSRIQKHVHGRGTRRDSKAYLDNLEKYANDIALEAGKSQPESESREEGDPPVSTGSHLDPSNQEIQDPLQSVRARVESLHVVDQAPSVAVSDSVTLSKPFNRDRQTQFPQITGYISKPDYISSEVKPNHPAEENWMVDSSRSFRRTESPLMNVDYTTSTTVADTTSFSETNRGHHHKCEIQSSCGVTTENPPVFFKSRTHIPTLRMLEGRGPKPKSENSWIEELFEGGTVHKIADGGWIPVGVISDPGIGDPKGVQASRGVRKKSTHPLTSRRHHKSRWETKLRIGDWQPGLPDVDEDDEFRQRWTLRLDCVCSSETEVANTVLEEPLDSLQRSGLSCSTENSHSPHTSSENLTPSKPKYQHKRNRHARATYSLFPKIQEQPPLDYLFNRPTGTNMRFMPSPLPFDAPISVPTNQFGPALSNEEDLGGPSNKVFGTDFVRQKVNEKRRSNAVEIVPQDLFSSMAMKERHVIAGSSRGNSKPETMKGKNHPHDLDNFVAGGMGPVVTTSQGDHFQHAHLVPEPLNVPVRPSENSFARQGMRRLWADHDYDDNRSRRHLISKHTWKGRAANDRNDS